jgi:hypothetical protein
MPTVFINYRREESAGEARALFNDLVSHLGEDAVFMDVDSIAPGQDFRDVVHERVATCDIMLSLVGKEWLTVTSRSGARRLDEPGDFVRLEIEAALKRKIPVAPVLLHGAEMPLPESLPEAVRDFAFRNAFELSHTRWESDVDEMLRRLRLLTASPHGDDRPRAAGHDASPASAPSRANGWPLAIALVALVAIGAAAYVYFARPRAAAPALVVAEATTAAPAAATGTVPAEATPTASNDPSVAAGTPAIAPAAAGTPASSATPPAPETPSASAPAPGGTAGVPLGVPLALGNQLAGQDACLERLAISGCANVPAQRWRFEGARDGMVRIRNANAGSGMCLDLVKDGNNLVPAFSSCGQTPGQRWRIAPAGAAARYFLFRNESSGAEMCLALGRRPDQTFVIRMVTCAGASAQRWRITPQ